MVMIQVDLDEEEDKTVSIYKIEKKLETKELAIKEIIKNSVRDCNHTFEVLKTEKAYGQKIMQRCTKCGMLRYDKIFPDGTIKTSFSKK